MGEVQVLIGVTYEPRGPDPGGKVGGVCSSPMALTEFSLFFNAANAELCGRSMSSP